MSLAEADICTSTDPDLCTQLANQTKLNQTQTFGQPNQAKPNPAICMKSPTSPIAKNPPAFALFSQNQAKPIYFVLRQIQIFSRNIIFSHKNGQIGKIPGWCTWSIYSSWLLNYISHDVQESSFRKTASSCSQQIYISNNNKSGTQNKFQTQKSSISETEWTFIFPVLKTKSDDDEKT